jgi:hypothetical protein
MGTRLARHANDKSGRERIGSHPGRHEIDILVDAGQGVILLDTSRGWATVAVTALGAWVPKNHVAPIRGVAGPVIRVVVNEAGFEDEQGGNAELREGQVVPETIRGDSIRPQAGVPRVRLLQDAGLESPSSASRWEPNSPCYSPVRVMNPVVERKR